MSQNLPRHLEFVLWLQKTHISRHPDFQQNTLNFPCITYLIGVIHYIWTIDTGNTHLYVELTVFLLHCRSSLNITVRRIQKNPKNPKFRATRGDHVLGDPPLAELDSLNWGDSLDAAINSIDSKDSKDSKVWSN